MSEIKLLPCPFCGGEAMFSDSNEDRFAKVRCVKCGCEIKTSGIPALEKAIEKWNTRKPMQEIVEMVKEKSFVDYDEYYTDCGEMLISFSDVIEIVKEVGGMND